MEKVSSLRHIANRRWVTTVFGAKLAHLLEGETQLLKLFRGATTLEQVTSLAVSYAIEDVQHWSKDRAVTDLELIEVLASAFPKVVIKSTETVLTQPDLLLCQLTRFVAQKEYDPSLPESYQASLRTLLELHASWRDVMAKQQRSQRNMLAQNK